jgi:phosphonate transport system permease protein
MDGRAPESTGGWLGYAALALAIGWVLHWSAAGAQMSWSELAGGMPQIGDFLSRSVPPDWSMLPRLWAPALETIQIAIWGTLLSVILALPLSFVRPAICTAGTGCAASRASFSM